MASEVRCRRKSAEHERDRDGAEDREPNPFWKIVLVAVLFVTAAVTDNKICNFLDDREKLADEDYDDIPRRAMLAMLVHAIYNRDYNLADKTCLWMMDFNNKRADGYMSKHWGLYPCSHIVSEKELKSLGLAFLLRQGSYSDHYALDLAIVLRGTIISKDSDIEACLKIAMQKLNESDRVSRTLQLILEVLKDCRQKYRIGRIYMAGHSLGAAIALIVGEILYSTYNIYIDTHLFNPPLVTDVVDILSGALTKLTGWRPSGCASDVSELMKEVCTRRGGEETGNLYPWTPHFYINPGDLICCLYIDVFKSKGIFIQSDARYFETVVPCAYVWISTWKEEKLFHPHSLLQWHKYKDEYIGLEFFRYYSRLHFEQEYYPADCTTWYH